MNAAFSSFEVGAKNFSGKIVRSLPLISMSTLMTSIQTDAKYKDRIDKGFKLCLNAIKGVAGVFKGEIGGLVDLGGEIYDTVNSVSSLKVPLRRLHTREPDSITHNAGRGEQRCDGQFRSENPRIHAQCAEPHLRREQGYGVVEACRHRRRRQESRTGARQAYRRPCQLGARLLCFTKQMGRFCRRRPKSVWPCNGRSCGRC